MKNRPERCVMRVNPRTPRMTGDNIKGWRVKAVIGKWMTLERLPAANPASP